MMEPKEVRAVIASSGLPVAYRAWTEGNVPGLPYCVYYAGRANNFGADGVVYHTSQGYTIELYSDEKDPAAEKAVETALTAAGIFWTKDETYIESERLHEIIYEIEV